MIGTYKINGMTCNGCANTVTNLLNKIPEVESVKIDLSAKEAKIETSAAVNSQIYEEALKNTPYKISSI